MGREGKWGERLSDGTCDRRIGAEMGDIYLKVCIIYRLLSLIKTA